MKKSAIFVTAFAAGLLCSVFPLVKSLDCAIYTSTSVVDDVTRTCADETDMLRAGAGLVTPCLWTCDTGIDYCSMTTSSVTDEHTGRCADSVYTQEGGACQSGRLGKICVCISSGHSSNLGSCSAANSVSVSIATTFLLVFFSAFFPSLL